MVATKPAVAADVAYSKQFAAVVVEEAVVVVAVPTQNSV